MSRKFAEGEWPRWTKRVREVESDVLGDYLEDVIEEAKTDYQTMMGVLSNHCESPIEALFLAAFLPYCLRGDDYEIRPQQKIGKYRADFVVTFVPEARYPRSLVVECDGHDFHERTKEQAERDKRRDRAISAAGYPVFRFTGRELHRDARACVEEIIDYTQTVLLDGINDEIRRHPKDGDEH